MEKKKIIKNIFSIHPLTYIFVFIGFLSGYFKRIILYSIIIIVHELGHFLTALLFNWKTDKIYIYPLGGITKFKDHINKPLYEELLVTIMGPIFQIIITYLLKDLDSTITVFSKLLLFFNLLPIIPLDGSKLFNIFFQICLPYLKSIYILFFISYTIYFTILIYLIMNIKSYFLIMVFFFLLFKIIEENKNIKYLFNNFILERYLHNYNFENKKIICKIKDMYKYKNNIFLINNFLYTEKEYLKEKIYNCKKDA